LSACYKILSDSDRRAVYDESGEIDEDDDAGILNEERDWTEYWRLLFKVTNKRPANDPNVSILIWQKITIEDIKNFEKTYRHSEEEMADLKQAYLDGDGDMKYILESVPCCTEEDQERYSDLILQWIEKDEVPFLKKFRQMTAKEIKVEEHVEVLFQDIPFLPSYIFLPATQTQSRQGGS
jgi:DnaJ family protein C protein 9